MTNKEMLQRLEECLATKDDMIKFFNFNSLKAHLKKDIEEEKLQHTTSGYKTCNCVADRIAGTKKTFCQCHVCGGYWEHDL
jgi:hypothetical protein